MYFLFCLVILKLIIIGAEYCFKAGLRYKPHSHIVGVVYVVARNVAVAVPLFVVQLAVHFCNFRNGETVVFGVPVREEQTFNRLFLRVFVGIRERSGIAERGRREKNFAVREVLARLLHKLFYVFRKLLRRISEHVLVVESVAEHN